MKPDDDAGVVDGADALIDGLLRELGRGGAPGADERFVGRVLRATESRRHAWGRPLALAAGVLLAVAGAWAWWTRPLCRLVEAESAVVRTTGWRPFGGVGPGDAVEVAAGGRGALLWPDGTRVVLGAASRVELPRRGDAFSLRLGHGRLDATVTPQPAGRPFALLTAEATLTVEGTAFTVTSGAAGTDVALRHGALRVTAPAGEVRLLPGDASAVKPGKPPSLGTASDAPVRFRESHRDLGWTWRSEGVTAYARWQPLQANSPWQRVLSVSAAAEAGRSVLPLPVLPARWRAVVQLRATRIDAGGQVALAVGEARLPLALVPGVWQRVHLVGDAQSVALVGAVTPTRTALTSAVDAIGVALTAAEVEIGEVVILDEAP